MDVRSMAESAKLAARRLGTASSAEKEEALLQMAEALERRMAEILQENQEDLAAGRRKSLGSPLLDRLLLDEHRLHTMAESIRTVVTFQDPIGEIVEGWRTLEGLAIEKRRVPFGLLTVVYESRPSVTADAVALCVKTGNALILWGGPDALRTNRIVAEVLTGAVLEAGLPAECINFVPSTDRTVLVDLLQLEDLIDVVIPRGGEVLQDFLHEHSRVPVIYAGGGNCHVYVDRAADLDLALAIAVNSKVQRPGTCGAVEGLLVHKDLAEEFLPRVVAELTGRRVRVYADDATRHVLGGQAEGILPAQGEHFATEFLDLEVAVKVVEDLEDAVAHIGRYGKGHSEAIITRDIDAARRFTDEVDAAAVYVNASTRFTDGGVFGLGAEIGVSTQKLHARGPLALRELTTTKYVVYGNGRLK